MDEEKEINIFDMPEDNLLEVVGKIEAMASSIRNDWSDPRTECREIWRLCGVLKEDIKAAQLSN